MSQDKTNNSSNLNRRARLGRTLRIALSGGLFALTVFLAGNHVAILDKASDMRSSRAHTATPIAGTGMSSTAQLANLSCTNRGVPNQHAP